MKTIQRMTAAFVSLLASAALAGDLEDGKALQQAGKFDEALPKFEAAAKADPTNVDAALGLCQVLTGLGRYDEAAKSVDPARKAHPENAALPAAKGRAFYLAFVKADAAEEKDVGEIEMTKSSAEKWIGEALKADLKNVDALLLRGWLWQKDGDDDKARSFFEQALAADPKSFEATFEVANYWYGKAFESVKQKEPATVSGELWAKAENGFFAATRLDPKSARAAANYAHCKAWQNEPGKEVALAYIKAADLSPNDDKLLFKAYQRMPKAERLATFQALSEAMPKNVARKRCFAYALMEEKFFDKAIAVIEEASKIEPKNAYVYIDEGDTRLAWGKVDDAIENYQEALGLLGADIDGEVVKKFGYTIGMSTKLSPDQRDKLWTIMWKSCPAHAALWSDIGVSYRDGANAMPKDAKKSLEWYLRAVAAAPDDAAIQNDTGVVYDYNLHQPEKGEPYYRRAIEIGKKQGYDWSASKSPAIGYRDSINNLAKLLEGQKRWKDLKEFAENDVPEEHPDRARWIKEGEAKKAEKPEKPEDKKK